MAENVLIGLLLTLFIVLMFLYWRLSRERTQITQDLQASQIEVSALKPIAKRAEHIQADLDEERANNLLLQQEQATLITRLEEREKALKETEVRFKDEFQLIANRTISNAHDDFLNRANETFAKFQTTALAQTDEKQAKIDQLLKPMKDTLTRYEEGLKLMREAQTKEQGALSNQISALMESTRAVQSEAEKLSTALKSGSGVRGQWGEMQLRNIVEAAGLSPHVDFEEQKSVSVGESGRRPDMVVNLPGDRVIAIDAKVSLSAYLDAVECDDDEQRLVYLTKHGDEVWQHVKTLSSKDYASALRKSNSLDFVVMFLAGDSLLTAALEGRKGLLQDAFDKGVLIATPVTLIAMLKSVAYNWRQENANQNAREVAALASDLYESLSKMGKLLSELGVSMEKSVKKYNETVGNIESRVMPRARKFSQYEMPGTEKEITELQPIEVDIREIQSGRDLKVSMSDVDILPKEEKMQQLL